MPFARACVLIAPAADRTGELRRLGFPGRHLGPVQMTTDTALAVTKIVVEDKSALVDLRIERQLADHDKPPTTVPLSKIPFVDNPTIRFDEVESVEMPFRYVKSPEGEPILPPGMKEHLHNDMDQAFDEDE